MCGNKQRKSFGESKIAIQSEQSIDVSIAYEKQKSLAGENFYR